MPTTNANVLHLIQLVAINQATTGLNSVIKSIASSSPQKPEHTPKKQFQAERAHLQTMLFKNTAKHQSKHDAHQHQTIHQPRDRKGR